MKRIFVLSFALTLINFSYAYTGYGICNYGKQVVDSVVCYSPTVMKDTMITGDIKVTGSLNAIHITAQGLAINGSVEINDSQIGGAVLVSGPFVANNVEFKKGIAVESDAITLNHSTVNGMVTVTSSDKTPYVQVQCSSVVTGAILFDGKPGVVQITGESIVKGKVVNGSMEFVKRSCN